MNKTGAKLAGSTHPGRYTPWNGSLSRPILRTYSAEVTSPGEQSPASSQCALYKRLTIVQHHYTHCQGVFCLFCKVFSRFSGISQEAPCATCRTPQRRLPPPHFRPRRTPVPPLCLLSRPAPLRLAQPCPNVKSKQPPRAGGEAASHSIFNTPRPSTPCAWRACRSRRTRRPNAPAQRGCTGR